MRVLVVGAAGEVGRMIIPALAARHELRLFDPRPSLQGDWFVGSVTDPEAVAAAVEGQDAVVYLAMGRKEGWRDGPGWAISHFDVSVKGLYLTLSAAARAGAGHVVYASSMSVFAGYLHRDYAADPAADEVDAYGLTKRLGEQVCEAAAREHGMQVVALRLAAPMPDEEWLSCASMPERVVGTAAGDVARAFLAALDHSGPFGAYPVTGDREREFLDWHPTRDALGWEPRARPLTPPGAAWPYGEGG
ncbi:NAD-dependent epimerase/dehydratase family protein [Nonomuraea endophytica]|uniref:NAD-dependent epimerase/dehydratase family protein n=1 Tax=Nonomuraea endophytica TaxID=714136 RepID=UPI0037C9ED22